MINLKSLPSSPGIYIYRNRAGDIIYVGKAINLKKRISQYFQRDDALGIKTSQLVAQIASIETKIVGSEIEALILEASFIKKYRPKYNSQLKDDRSYIYICISGDQIPRVFTSHLASLPPKADIYGPFPDGSSVKSLLKIIRRIFPYRSQEKHPKGDCLYCHLGLCPGLKPDLHLYRKSINHIKQILSGEVKSLQKKLRREMTLASKSQNYELAAILRDQFTSLDYVVSGQSNLNNLYQDVNLPEDKQSSAINELKSVLNLSLINRIECFDISQLGVKYFVGSMVVWQDGHVDHSQYRKFKIRYKTSPDDQLMIKEVVYRRLKHPEWGTPDLIVVDGGKPQVAAAEATAILSERRESKDLLIIGLAKKLETIVIKNRAGLPAEWQEINLPHHSNALRLLQQLRDEAHRFANHYRKELISKQWLN